MSDNFELTAKEKSVLLDPARLAVLRDLALVDETQEPVFNTLTQLGSKIVGAPISLMSMVGGDYQFFKSSHGLDLKETDIEHAFCRHVVVEKQALVVEDARAHDTVKDNPSIEELGMVAYLGYPLTLSNGTPLGSFCVIDNVPHTWSDEDQAIMCELAEIVSEEINLREQFHRGTVTEAQLKVSQARVARFADAVDTTASKADILQQIKIERRGIYDMR